jgi:glycosyltransferase involved in cell wall biosynthesis
VTDAQQAPVISVVVPTYGRPDRLGGLIAALEAQDIDAPFEVIVVDDGSPAATWDELRRLAAATTLGARLILERLPANAGPAVARNVGWRRAQAPLVAFTDDDCAPTRDWLRNLLRALAEHDVVQGATVPDPGGRWGPFSRSIEETHEEFYPTCNVGYRRSLLDRLDGFDLAYRNAVDDTDLAMRARKLGARTTFAADAVVHHAVHQSDYVAFLREKPRWETVPLICRRHPEVRASMHSRFVWRSSHTPAIAAAIGLILAMAGGAALGAGRGAHPVKWSTTALAGGILVVPYIRFRTTSVPLPGTGRRQRWLLLPAALLADVYEVAIMVKGSIRYRTIVL